MIDGNVIEIEKGAEYLATAKKVSNIIAALPISPEQNNELIAALQEHTDAGRMEAYRQGVREALTTDLPEQLAREIMQDTPPQLLS